MQVFFSKLCTLSRSLGHYIIINIKTPTQLDTYCTMFPMFRLRMHIRIKNKLLFMKYSNKVFDRIFQTTFTPTTFRNRIFFLWKYFSDLHIPQIFREKTIRSFSSTWKESSSAFSECIHSFSFFLIDFKFSEFSNLKFVNLNSLD